MRSSHGCMRFYPEDIAELYDQIPVGTKVTVVNQPFVFGWHRDAMYVQAFPVLEDDEREHPQAAETLLNAGISDEMWQKLKAAQRRRRPGAGQRDGRDSRVASPCRCRAETRRSRAIIAAARHVENRVPARRHLERLRRRPVPRRRIRSGFATACRCPRRRRRRKPKRPPRSLLAPPAAPKSSLLVATGRRLKRRPSGRISSAAWLRSMRPVPLFHLASELFLGIDPPAPESPMKRILLFVATNVAILLVLERHAAPAGRRSHPQRAGHRPRSHQPADVLGGASALPAR